MAQPKRKQIIEKVVADLELLPAERLEEVSNFVEFLRQKQGLPKRGSPGALLRSFGSWEGPTGELDQLVDDIYEARHREE